MFITERTHQKSFSSLTKKTTRKTLCETFWFRYFHLLSFFFVEGLEQNLNGLFTLTVFPLNYLNQLLSLNIIFDNICRFIFIKDWYYDKGSSLYLALNWNFDISVQCTLSTTLLRNKYKIPNDWIDNFNQYHNLIN